MTAVELSDWLRGVAAEVAATKPDYPLNVARGCPIPFFGDVLNARVLTIGVNPSDKEVTEERLWFEPLSFPDWQKRLLNYFNWPDVPPYCWFETWSICLELLGLSYAAGEAAHLDVSPRPTTPMLDEVADKSEFRKMAEHDAKWFFELLGKLPQIQLLVVAGPIPRANGSKQQLADFIDEQAGAHGAEWRVQEPLPKLVTPNHPHGIPVFICPYERKVDGLYAMVRQIYRNRELLRCLAARRSLSVPILPARLDWSSLIGNFIINFGILDLHVLDFLESLVAPEEFQSFKGRSFHDRVELIKQRLGRDDCALKRKKEFEQFFHRLDPVRITRNQIAHGILRVGMAADQKTWTQTLCVPRDLDSSDSPDGLHVEFAQLRSELKMLNELIEEFQRLDEFKEGGASAIPEDLR